MVKKWGDLSWIHCISLAVSHLFNWCIVKFLCDFVLRGQRMQIGYFWNGQTEYEWNICHWTRQYLSIKCTVEFPVFTQWVISRVTWFRHINNVNTYQILCIPTWPIHSETKTEIFCTNNKLNLQMVHRSNYNNTSSVTLMLNDL